jgi:pimeloyl-ACP methyl ester carboxylesterase
MADLSSAFAQWLLSQLDNLPSGLLRDGAELLTADRLLAHIFEGRESAHVRALFDMPDRGGSRRSTILVPGLLGSLLASTRGLSAMLWFNPMVLMDGHVNLMDLAEDGRSDRSPDVDITPVGIEKITYLDLIRTLATHSRLYQFPYDWRKHIEGNADLLRESIRRWNSVEPGRRYTIVAHSMGGLVARTYLTRYPHEAERLIERVIMIGTPYNGAPSTMMTFTEEQHPGRLVNRLNEHNDMLGFTANLPSLYQLLPPPPELYRPQCDYPFDWDIYDASAWGLPWIRQDYLNDSRALHQILCATDPQVDMVSIVGCHQRTVSRVSLNPDNPHAPLTFFYGDNGALSGDDKVPLWSSCDTRLSIYYVEEAHARLPINEEVLQAVVNLLYDEPAGLPQELPEPRQGLKGLAAVPLVQQVAELRERMEQGRITRKDIEQFFFDR